MAIDHMLAFYLESSKSQINERRLSSNSLSEIRDSDQSGGGGGEGR